MQKSHARQASPAYPTLEVYLRDINDTPLLDADEEQELAWRIDAGDFAARDHLVRANLRLVVNLARHYVGRGVSLEDLIAEGNLGLMRAAEGFDPSRGLRFSTYASYWVKQSIKRAVINTGKTVRIPAYMAELLVKWRRAAAGLHEELGRPATPEEIADRLGLSPKKLRIIQKAIRIHNASPAGDDDSAPSLEELARDGLPAPDARLSGSEELGQVLTLIDRLEGREASVLRMRFGLDGEEPRTLKEIGERLGLTRERVRQIERDGLCHLREHLAA